MKFIKQFLVICLPVVLFACNTAKKVHQVKPSVMTDTIIQKINDSLMNKITPGIDHSKTDSFLVNLLKKCPQYFDTVLMNKKAWNIQIIYTEVNRDRNNTPSFTDYYYNVDSSQYFYPASTVKLPTALLALQRLNELSNTGITRKTTLVTEAAYSGQTVTYNDPQTADGRPTIENYIKRILLVSDNEAFNRLYEFLGQQYINQQLHAKGYEDVQILHRLDVSLTEDENRHTNPVKFLDSNNNILYSQPQLYNNDKYSERHDSLGEAYYSAGKLINSPMNFSNKNKISLQDLHQIMRSVIFPANVPAKQQFNLAKNDYDFVHQYMSQFPSETIHPSYDTLPDAYVKFLLYGSRTEALPKNIRIFNKVGDAYGQVVDVAYIVDFEKKIEFFLSAAINCNTDGVLNDDKYDYDTIGFPFMKNLGQVIYDYELKRKRTFLPDLSSFKITYDK